MKLNEYIDEAISHGTNRKYSRLEGTVLTHSTKPEKIFSILESLGYTRLEPKGGKEYSEAYTSQSLLDELIRYGNSSYLVQDMESDDMTYIFVYNGKTKNEKGDHILYEVDYENFNMREIYGVYEWERSIGNSYRYTSPNLSSPASFIYYLEKGEQ
jgi:spermidine/putrescine-binding protein